ncbi:YjcZ family sporulation protein [Paenibacillus foliorum]|nr:YjcZ family sporulation protein [Paenibacillus foliorum]
MGFGVGGVGTGSCSSLFTSTGVILVLFILLVIVSRSFI